MIPLDPTREGRLRFAARMPRFPKKIALLALGLAAACGEHAISSPPPHDRFFFPTGMAVRHLPDGRTQLLVVSSNFDLRYDTGTLLSVDPDASGDALQGDTSLAVLGTADRPGWIPVDSFGGELKVAEWAACPPLGENLAITTSRQAVEAYFVSLGDDGSLTCGDGCRLPLNQGYADPYGVVVACSSFYPRASAFFTYLRGPQNEGLVSEVPLATDANGVLLTPGSTGQRTRNDFDLGVGDVHSGAFDPVTARLFLTPNNTVGADPLRWLELTVPRLYSPAFPVQSYDLYAAVRGSIGRGIALSTDGTRAYLTLVLYDSLEASRSGSIFVQGSALAILDIRPDPTGITIPQVLDVLPLESGAAEVQVIARPGRRDLLAITSSDAGSLVLYDDDVGQVVKTFGTDAATGLPVLGRQPFGVALEEHPDPSRCTRGAPCVRLFVGSFEQGTVGVVELDPQRPWNAALVKVLGVAQ